jgi:hypothetical protein
MTAGQVTIGGALAYALALLKKNWRAIWGVLALTSLANVVYITGQLAGQQGIGLIGIVAVVITSLMSNGAINRLALADRHPGDPEFVIGHQGIQWRASEWRMLLASLLLGVFVFFLLILVTLVGLAVLAGVLQAKGVPMRMGMTLPQLGAALGPVAAGGLEIAVAALVVLAIYLATRLSLVLPATVDAKAVRVLQTWKLTGRSFWPILVTLAVAQLPVSLISGQIGGAILGSGALPSTAGPDAILAAALIMGVPVGAFILPLTAGVTAYFQRTLSDGLIQAPRPPSER